MKCIQLLICCLTTHFSLAQCPDLDALRNFYQALRQDGPWEQMGNPINWDTASLDCSTFYGVLIDPFNNNRVIGIDLDGDPNFMPGGIDQCSPSIPIGLSGQLPNPLIFPYLRLLSLSKGNISGPLPDFSASSTIQTLHLSCNKINNSIIPGNLPDGLINLFLESNQITGSFPDLDIRPGIKNVNLTNNLLSGTIPNLTQVKLTELLLAGNNLSGIIQGFAGHPLNRLNLSNNHFTFEDMLPNYAELRLHDPILYPQKTVTLPDTDTMPIGGDWAWNLEIDDTVTTSIYHWIHNNDTIITPNNTLVRELQSGDAGDWRCAISNSIVKGVVLQSSTFSVILCQPDIDSIDTVLCPGQSLMVRGLLFDQSRRTGKIQIPGVAANGCDSLYVVNLHFPEKLDAGPDTTICCDSLLIKATLPVGYQGFWTALDGGVVEQSDQPITQVNDFKKGINRFTWYTSSAECPVGDIDTVFVKYNQPPLAKDILLGTHIDESIDGKFLPQELLQDSLFDILEVLNLPSEGGDFNSDNSSNFEFNPDRLYFGTYNVQYSLCSNNCPQEFCDTANIAIEVTPEMQPSLVSFNNDGENDVFVIEELAADPNELPGNHLIIFTHHGEVLWDKPEYQNNWPQPGKCPPQGVYYYVFFASKDDKKGRSGTILVIY